MKLNVALFFAGLFGALAVVFILLSFGTDYWLMASESCKSDGSVAPIGVACASVPGFFLLCVVVMFVLWLEVLDVVTVYIDYQRATLCPNFALSIDYGLSFMFAPIGIFFCFLSGLLFLLIGRTIRIHYH